MTADEKRRHNNETAKRRRDTNRALGRCINHPLKANFAPHGPPIPGKAGKCQRCAAKHAERNKGRPVRPKRDRAAWARQQREEARAKGLCGCCRKREALPNRYKCLACQTVNYEPVSSYEPIDEWLRKPRNRILRTLRWFDWLTSIELMDVLEVSGDDRRERDRYRQVLHRCVREGVVECRSDTQPRMYRVAPAVPSVRFTPPVDTRVIEVAA